MAFGEADQRDQRCTLEGKEMEPEAKTRQGPVDVDGDVDELWCARVRLAAEAARHDARQGELAVVLQLGGKADELPVGDISQ